MESGTSKETGTKSVSTSKLEENGNKQQNAQNFTNDKDNASGQHNDPPTGATNINAPPTTHTSTNDAQPTTDTSAEDAPPTTHTSTNDAPPTTDTSAEDAPPTSHTSTNDAPPTTDTSAEDAPPTTHTSTNDAPHTTDTSAEDAPPTTHTSTNDAPHTTDTSAEDAPPTTHTSTNDAPPTTDTSAEDAPPTTHTSTNDAPPTTDTSAEDAPPTTHTSTNDAPPTTDTSAEDAPPTTQASTNDAPPTTDTLAEDAPPTSHTSTNDAPPTTDTSAEDAPPTIQTSTNDAPPTSDTSAEDAPPTTHTSTNDAPPTTDTSAEDAPPTTHTSTNDAPPPSDPSGTDVPPPTVSSANDMHPSMTALPTSPRPSTLDTILKTVAPNPPPQTSANDDKGKSETGQTTDGPIVGGDETGASESMTKQDVLSSGVIKKKQGLTGHEPEYVLRIVRGDVSVKCPSEAKLVRIFVSSTFTDTRHERNWLMERVYPKLKEFCQSKGYEFQIVDMRWGIRDEAQDDHMTTEICLREVEQCKEKSTGPCFMSLMSHKYGYRDLPRTILASEFDLLIESIEDETVKKNLQSWFQLDENALPAIYVLQPISSRLTNVRSKDEGLQKEARDDWWTQYSQMHTALATAAEKRLDDERARVYKRSVSETEVINSLQGCSSERLVWFHRIIEDIDKVEATEDDDIVSKYKDKSRNTTKDEESQRLLMHLENKILKENLPRQNIYEYKVNWEPGKGIDPDLNQEHKQYLSKLCEDSEKLLRSLLESAFNSRDQIVAGNPIYTEALQHMNFCQNKCEAFYGRENSLKIIENYLKGDSRQPFIIYGKSGCGKTSLVAMAARLANQIHGDKSVNIIRFIGTTPESSSLHAFMTSVINQLRQAVAMDVLELTTKTIKRLTAELMKAIKAVAMLNNQMTVEELTSELMETIKALAGINKQMVLFFDSLDQFDPAHGSRTMEWLGDLEKLPEKVKVILSTLPDAQYVALPYLQTIKQLTAELMKSIKAVALLNNQKTIEELTSELMVTIKAVAGLNKHIVLFFDSLDQFDPALGSRRMEWLGDLVNLPEKVKVILSTLPDAQYEALPILQAKLKTYPQNFLDVPVLEKNDIEGILAKWLESASRTLTDRQRETVLNAFKNCPLPLYLKLTFDEAVQWKSYSPESMTVLEDTVRGCIDKLFLKMEKDHGKVFVSKALGYLTASHSGLSEAELEDILSCHDDVLGDVYRYWTPPIRRLPPLLLVRMKRDLGQYVVNRRADGREVFYWYHRQFIEAAQNKYCKYPEVTKKLHEGIADFFAGTWAEGNDGKVHQADRQVISQPLKQGTEFNVRKLTSLPYHRVRAGDVDKLKKDCLLNYKFLVAKIEACGLKSVLNDFHDAREVLKDDQEMDAVRQALYISQKALLFDLRTFSSQMLGRIQSSQLQSYPAMSEFMSKFMKDCRNPDHIYLEPDRPILTPCCQQLVSSIAEHTYTVTALAMNKTGTKAVTCSNDRTIKVYDLIKRTIIRTIPNVGYDVDRATLACGETVVVVNPDEKISAWDLNTRVCKWTHLYYSGIETYVVGGPDNSKVLIVSSLSRTYKFVDTATGQIVKDNVSFPDEIRDTVHFSGKYSPVVGHDKWMVVQKDQKVCLVFDVETMTLSHYKKVLKKNDEVVGLIVGLSISPDGDTLYMVNMDNDLHYVKTSTLEILKVLPGCEHDYWAKYHVDPIGKYLYSSSGRFVRVWDLQTGLKATALDIPNIHTIQDGQTLDMNTLVTINDDSTLKIWDLSRGNKPVLEFADYPRDFKVDQTETRYSSLYPTESPRYFIMEWEQNEGTVIGVYDTVLRKYVRQASYVTEKKDEDFYIVTYVDDWTMIVRHNYRLKLLDLRTMKVTTVLQSTSAAYRKDIIAVNGGKDVAVFSRGRMHVKIMNRQTGKTEAIMKAGQQNYLFKMVTNKTGTVIAAEQNKGTILIFDPIRRAFDFEITPDMVGLSEDLMGAYMTLDTALISDDGQYLSEYQGRVFVTNLKTRKLEHELIDYEQMKVDKQMYVKSMTFLDDHRLLTTHYDQLLRIFDFKKGTLLNRLSGHISYISLSYHMGSAIIITRGCGDEEHAIRLWDASTLECIAVYSYDDGMKDFQLLGPKSSTIVATLDSDLAPVFFTMKGKGAEKYTEGTVSEASFPEVFQGVTEVSKIDLSHPDEMTIDDDDPDDDPEEVSEPHHPFLSRLSVFFS